VDERRRETYIKEVVTILLIESKPLALDVRPVDTHGSVLFFMERAGPFVPGHACPLEHPDDVFN
jgi:hypothetical protein